VKCDERGKHNDITKDDDPNHDIDEGKRIVIQKLSSFYYFNRMHIYLYVCVCFLFFQHSR
jgi:hypothetical protein